jgi:hypothetical protein
MKKLFYLASPYSAPESRTQELRFDQACRTAAALKRAGLFIFSPIAHSHPIAAHGLPGDFSFWQTFCELTLGRCDGMIVLCLPGWQTSTGVSAEIKLAEEKRLPIYYLDPRDLSEHFLEVFVSTIEEEFAESLDMSGPSLVEL